MKNCPWPRTRVVDKAFRRRRGFVRRERNYLRRRNRVAALSFSADLAGVRRLLDAYPFAGANYPASAERRAKICGDGSRETTFDYRIGISGEALIVLVRHQAQDDPAQSYAPDDAGENFD